MSVEDFETNLSDAAGGQAKGAGRTMGQINDSSARKRTAVVDANHCLETVVEIGDAHPGAKGEPTVGCGVSAWPENLTVGGATAVEARSVPTGLADLGACCSYLLTGCQGSDPGLLQKAIVEAGGRIGREDAERRNGARGKARSVCRHWGTASQQQSGRSEETKSKHDERNALDEQNDWRRITPGSEQILLNRTLFQVI